MPIQEPVWCVEHGDCLDVMKKMPDACVDSVVCDPPAGIAFMGKAWDRMKRDGMTELQAFQEFIREVFVEVYRVLKPGGHAVVWALPRTSHHTAMGLERAGFDIRDNGTYLFHVFGSGFPKSLDVSKAIDKEAGVERKVVGMSPNWRESKRNREHFGSMEVRGENAGLLTEATTAEAKRWAGWGTALKPAVEFWILARKPLDGTVAANVLEHGTGALNIDGCRIPLGTDETSPTAARYQSTQQAGNNGWQHVNRGARFDEEAAISASKGRWPAHLILDEGAAAILDEQSAGVSRFFYVSKAAKRDKDEGLDEFVEKSPGEKTERQEGSIGISPYAGSRGPSKNVHPTVKPTALMQYLVRLVTPPGGVVLDPFMGSGSTGKAALLEGFSFIGIEREAEYLEIATARLRHADAKRKEVK